jgi:hypothetical protein
VVVTLLCLGRGGDQSQLLITFVVPTVGLKTPNENPFGITDVRDFADAVLADGHAGARALSRVLPGPMHEHPAGRHWRGNGMLGDVIGPVGFAELAVDTGNM